MIDKTNGALSDAASEAASELDIAIISMIGRFPGARNLDEFWRNLRDGVESISRFSDEELAAAGVAAELLTDPNYVRAGGILEGIELFDAPFFGFYAREAEVTDPQQRLFLECAWEAIEKAGYNPDQYAGLIGVYAGTGSNTYLLSHLIAKQAVRESVSDYQLMIGGEKDFVATRVSYKLNLRGPSVNVQSACSTSLVAIHLACQGLLNYQCDMALAGGVSLPLLEKRGYLHQEGGILSRDGHCRAFDAKANGTVNAGGVGVVVLKRLADALGDGDSICAVIKGSAINNDGSLKVGYTAPSADGQARAITTAQVVAGVAPETIQYIETHGTGTIVGDPIEIAALTQAFRRSTSAKAFCALGSVKTNIGHTDAAAGVAGLIKTVLALTHKQIPPSLNFDKPNPAIDFANSPFYVNAALSEWKRNGAPRRAGVSSFGIGGTNAHVIVEEAPVPPPSGPSRSSQLLLLSARTETALEAVSANLARWLSDNRGVNLADLAYTLQVGRKSFAHRRMLVCREADDARQALDTRPRQRVFSAVEERRDRAVAFMFTGQGSQYVRMAEGLYASEPTFRKHVDRCAELLKPRLGLDLRDVVYPNAPTAETPQPSEADRLNQTWLTQPALFTVEYALAQLWMEWGVKPVAMIGHSIGEYVAACLAGVYSVEEALALVAGRGRLMQSLPGGAMVSVALSENEVRPLLGETLSIAAVNGPDTCVVAGPAEAVKALEVRLNERQVAWQRLRTSHAFHSPMMDPILEPFTALAREIRLQPPAIPFVSNVSGTWMTEAEAIDPRYWARHLRHTVRFAEGVRELMSDPDLVLLEVGPAAVLTGLARLNTPPDGDRAVLSSLSRQRKDEGCGDGASFILETLGRLWLAGVPIDWRGFYAREDRRRVPLPAYPFERRRYWIEPDRHATVETSRETASDKRAELADWLYVPSWKRVDLPLTGRPGRQLSDEEPPLLVLGDGRGLGAALVDRLRGRGQRAVTVLAGSGFAEVDEWRCTVRADEEADYDRLLKQLQERGQFPQTIVHLLNVAGDEAGSGLSREWPGLHSLLPLVRSLGRCSRPTDIRILVVSSEVHEVTGEEPLSPERATLLAACKITPQEYPNVSCQNIDVNTGDSAFPAGVTLDRLVCELDTQTTDVVIAYRGSHRWVQTHEAIRLDQRTPTASRLRQHGAYLITGGLDRIGLMCAEYLARKVGARLVLLGERPFPSRQEWDQWPVTHSAQDETSRTIERLKAIESTGAEVMVVSADVDSEEQMREAVRAAEARFGALNGVIHSATNIGVERSTREMQQIGPDDLELHFGPKVRGLKALEAVLRDRPLDFVLLESSLSVVLGGIGFAGYTAANAYMDVFAQSRNRSSPIPWLVVNWDQWVAERQENGSAGAVHELSFTSSEGEVVLERALAMDAPLQLIVSTGDLQKRIAQWVQREWRQEKLAAVTAEPQAQFGAPGTEATPQAAVESQLTRIWEKLLGVSPIRGDDNFFNLGGHSLLAIQLVGRARETFHVPLSLGTFLEMPTIAEMAAAIARFRSEPVQANEADRTVPEAARVGNAAPLPVIVPDAVDKHQPFPLTEVQQAYWVGRSGSFELGNVATHTYDEIDCVDLDLERYRQAWQTLISRHEMLRAIVRPDGQQQILEQVPRFEIPILDLRAHDAASKLAQLEAIRTEMSHQVFDPDRWPLFEIRASRLDEHLVRLHVSADFLIIDGWSSSILARELYQLYRSADAALPNLEITFRDYVLAEIALRGSEPYRHSEEYWLNRLNTLPPAPELPLAKDPGLIARPHFVRRSGRLEKDCWSRLKDRAGRAGLTPSGLLLAAFSEILKVWSKSPKFTINLTLFNRLPLHPQVNQIVGDSTSLTLLEVNQSADDTFEARAKELQRQLWKDLDHSRVSGVRVMRELAKKQGSVREGVMPVVFTSTLGQQSPRDLLAPLGTFVYGITQTPQVWLDHVVFEQGGALTFNWDAVEEIFPPGLLDDMFGAYCGFLRRIAEDESAWQEEGSRTAAKLVPPGQLAQRAEVNHTESPLTDDLLHTLFGRQVRERSEQPAVIACNRTLTYRQLDRWANQIGRWLREQGARRNTLVAVVMEKGWEQVAATLGILASGAAYLPIDAAIPVDRLRYLLEHGEVEFVLTQPWLAAKIEWPRGIKPLSVDDASLASVGAGALDAIQTPEDLAYVIYTSGSTGLPKGVAIDHRGAVNTILDMNRRFNVQSRDRVLALSSLTFDLSVYDIFGTLAAGGAIVVPEPSGLRDPAHWADLLVANRVTIWNSVPALMQMMVEYIEGRGERLPADLRLVLMSGDWIPVALPNEIRARADALEVVSLGGATEASIWSIIYPIGTVGAGWKSIPYGRPMVNQTFHVFNDAWEPCPVWVAGHLFIGGIGLAQGYWRDEEKTRASFIEHPKTGERLYRTGDQGRYLPDGNIEFLGRNDFQVKVQGYRVELEEIEAVLGEHPAVRSSIVTAVGEAFGNKRLVAYVVAKHEPPARNELARFLSTRLPEYMLPAAYVMMDHLPLSANGKVDRRALPEPAALDLENSEDRTGDVTSQTARIARLVSDVLKIKHIDPEVNLFNLGATSIDVIRIVNLLDRELGYRPKIDAFYRAPTIAALTNSYEQHLLRKPAKAPELVDLTMQGTPQSVVASFKLLSDPAEREAFKKRQLGSRSGDHDTTSIQLPVKVPDPLLKKRFAERRSHRRFSLEPIRLEQLSRLLTGLRRIELEGKAKHLYASAGGLYAVQTYLYVKPGRIEGLRAGSYYYRPVDHRLLPLVPDVEIDRNAYDALINRPIYDQAGFAIYLIAQLKAIAPMYGERSVHFATIEAGLICQLLETAAPKHGIGLCQIGSLEFPRIRALFDLEESHVLVHSLLGGRILDDPTNRWSPFQEAAMAARTDREEGTL